MDKLKATFYAALDAAEVAGDADAAKAARVAYVTAANAAYAAANPEAAAAAEIACEATMGLSGAKYEAAVKVAKAAVKVAKAAA